MAIPKDVTDALNSMHGFAAMHPAFSTRDLNVLTQHIDAQDAEITKLRRIVSHEHIVADVALSSKSVMVAKLRDYCELVKSTEQMDKPYTPHEVIDGICDGVLAIINAEPAEPRTLSDFVNLPPADKQRVGMDVAEMATDMQRAIRVDIEVIREAIISLTFSHPCTATQRRCMHTAKQLSKAIGDTK